MINLPETTKCKVEVLTPAFPGAEDAKVPKECFEGVRPSSVLYGMRWWFRALAGAEFGSGSLKAIREAESLIFGTTHPVARLEEVGKNGCASRIRVAVAKNVSVDLVAEFEHETATQSLRYLTYGLYPTDPKKKNWKRAYIPPGSSFEVAVSVISPPRTGRAGVAALAAVSVSLDLVRALLELWVCFGGLGARWRHGLGGMRLKSGNMPREDDVPSLVAERLRTGRALVREFLDKNMLQTSRVENEALPAFPIVDTEYLEVAWNPKVGADADAVIEYAAKLWREYRLAASQKNARNTVNAATYANFLSSVEGSDTVKLAGLGLPIPFGFPQWKDERPQNGLLVPVGSVRGFERPIDRRASPIWLRPVKYQTKNATHFGLLVFHWRSVYLPKDIEVEMRVSKGDRPPVSKSVSIDVEDSAHWFQYCLLRKKFVKLEWSVV